MAAKRTYDQLHVRPTLRFAYAVDGRPAMLTRRAAYNGAKLAAVSKRCDCYPGSGAADDPGEQCDYHFAIADGHARARDDEQFDDVQRHLRALERIVHIYKAEDAATLVDIERPALDLSNMRRDELEEILVAVDWHLANGHHRPAKRRP